jgi:PAS domain S-box-containing protein
LVWLGWHTDYLHHVAEQARDETARGEKTCGVIVHLDEVLTMSARMAAATGDVRWEERYRQYEPQLNAAIREARAMAPNSISAEAIALTDAANIRLVEMENRAFALVREGRAGEAMALLAGPEYESQKKIYFDGVGNLLAVIRNRSSATLYAWHLKLFLSFCAVAALFVVTLVTWIVVMRILRRWYASLLAETAERRKAEETLRQSEGRFALAMEATRDGLWDWDIRSGHVYYSPRYFAMLGYAPDEFAAGDQSWLDLMHPDDRANAFQVNTDCIEGRRESFEVEFRMRARNGDWRWIVGRGKAVARDVQGRATRLVGTHVDATERKRAEEERDRLFNLSLDMLCVAGFDGFFKQLNPAWAKTLGWTNEELLSKPFLEFVHPDDRESTVGAMKGLAEGRPIIGFENRYLSKDGSYKWIAWNSHPLVEEKLVFAVVRNVTERKQADEQIHHQLETLGALYANAQDLTQTLDLDEVARVVTRSCVEYFGARLAWVGHAESDGSVRRLTHYPAAIDYPTKIVVRWDDSPKGQGPTGRAIRGGVPVVIADIASDPSFLPWHEAALACGIRCAAAFPLVTRGKSFGALNLYSDKPGFFTPERLDFFQTYANEAAASLENARLFTDAERRLERVQALRAVDIAITASLDLRVSLNTLLDQVTARLHVDAADVLLLEPHTQTLEYGAGRGFRSRALQHTHLRLGEGLAGRAALERSTISRAYLAEHPEEFTRAPLLAAEAFASYYGVPLIVKGQVKGVLEVFHREPLAADPEWLEFLETLAGQAAIAVDNAILFNDLQRSNVELMLAYDATIEGLSRALDLRDKETEGHSQRVTEMTVAIARALGMSGEELVHVRRDAPP